MVVKELVGMGVKLCGKTRPYVGRLDPKTWRDIPSLWVSIPPTSLVSEALRGSEETKTDSDKENLRFIFSFVFRRRGCE